DGVSSETCNPARGARYNSAIRYSSSHDECVIISKSEDGGINVIPYLRPRIRKHELDHAIESIEKLINAAELDYKQITEQEDWIRARAFYLSKEQCNKLNELDDKYHQRRVEKGDPYVDYGRYEASSDMNDSYFY